MKNSDVKFLGFCLLGLAILFVIMASMMGDQQDQIKELQDQNKELQYKIDAQQKLLDYHNEVLVNINRKVQFPGG